MVFRKAVFALLCLFSINAQCANYVTVCSEGNQLGGQLTTYAVVLGYAWAHGLSPVFSKEQLLSVPGGQINYHYIFNRLQQEFPNSNPPTHIRSYGGRNPPSYPENAKESIRGRNVCFCGMPTYPLIFFNSFRDRIRELFGPSAEVIGELRSNSEYAHIMDHPSTVAVHVRAYDPRLSIHWCLGKEYFERAMDLFSSQYLFVIFSDRIDWCKANLNMKGKHVIFVESKNHIHDLYLMSFCKNIITANSTFSWWAAYLKQNDGGLILVPDKWFEHEDPAYRKTFYPSHYTVFPVGTIPRPDGNLLNYSTTSLGD